MKFRLIGDVHGKIKEYLRLINYDNSEIHTIQLGDLSFDYSFLSEIDSNKHKFIAGNHDHHMRKYEFSNYLGDFGTYNSIYFISGAYSIDYAYRTSGYDFFINEELSYIQLEYAIRHYKNTKPNIVISHDCPSIVPIRKEGMLKRYGIDENFISNTVKAYNIMLKYHQPKIWVFGHHHKSFDENINGTRFKCLNELEFFDLDILEYSA